MPGISRRRTLQLAAGAVVVAKLPAGPVTRRGHAGRRGQRQSAQRRQLPPPRHHTWHGRALAILRPAKPRGGHPGRVGAGSASGEDLLARTRKAL